MSEKKEAINVTMMILKILNEAGKALRLKEILKLSGMNYQTVRSTLHFLKSTGLIGGDVFDAWEGLWFINEKGKKFLEESEEEVSMSKGKSRLGRYGSGKHFLAR